MAIMKHIDAIRKAMALSIQNAEQWIKDGTLLVENGSTVHGSVLLDYAGEEIAKAYACWQVLIGAYPPDHPIVQPTKKKTLQSMIEKAKK
ncbi:MAG: hypothetical protein ACE5IO_08585, partial [Thermoplasmata archaeon]